MDLQERYRDEVNIYNYYNPYRIKENVEPFQGGFPIIFMTTPGMNIFESDNKVFESLLVSNPVFSFLADTDPYILRQLQFYSTGGGTTSPFIKLLTNRFKGMILKDFNMKTMEDYENYQGWKQILPASTNDNFTAEASLNISFSESKNLDVTKIMYAWMNYIEAVRLGYHEPAQITRDNRILDFTSSIYFFLLDFDMRTILYFCKYTGVYPINIPLSNLVMGDILTKAPVDTNITFAYQYKEELNPQIIYDFNLISNDVEKIFGFNKKKYLDNRNGLSLNNYKTYGISLLEKYDPKKVITDEHFHNPTDEKTIEFTKKAKQAKQAESALATYATKERWEQFKKETDQELLNADIYALENGGLIDKKSDSIGQIMIDDYDGRDFIFKKDYNHVTIKYLLESDYVEQNQTSFNSALNESRRSLVLCFSNNDKEVKKIDYNPYLHTSNSLDKDTILKATQGFSDVALYGTDEDLLKANGADKVLKRQRAMYEVYRKKSLYNAINNTDFFKRLKVNNKNNNGFKDINEFIEAFNEEYEIAWNKEDEDEELSEENKKNGNATNWEYPEYFKNDKFDFDAWINAEADDIVKSEQGTRVAESLIKLRTKVVDELNSNVKSFDDWVKEDYQKERDTAQKNMILDRTKAMGYSGQDAIDEANTLMNTYNAGKLGLIDVSSETYKNAMGQANAMNKYFGNFLD